MDVSTAPPLKDDATLFPEDYQQRMRWGTYRPGVYFGIKGRHPGSLLFGLAWGSADGKKLRHNCQSGELEAFSWLEHDGETYGLEEIEDKDLQLKLRTTFVKDAERPDRAWHARIDAEPLVAEPAKKRPVSLFVYLGAEAEGDLLRERPRGDAPKWTLEEDGSWTGSVTLTGHDPVQGPFAATVVFRLGAGAAGVNGTAPTAWRRAAAQVAAERAGGTEQATTGVWNAEEHIRRHLRRAKEPKKPKEPREPKEHKPPPYAVLPDKALAGPANWWAAQLLARPSAAPRIEVHVTFGNKGEPSEREQPAAELGAELDMLAASASREFGERLSATFPLKAPFHSPAHRSAAAVAVSGLLGGLGHFRGRLLARQAPSSEELERLPEASLFSGVPSRSFFPRGFLWDEGFHGLLLVRWQPRVFLDVLAHWLELQQRSGWVPREVPLGAEQEARVPPQFLAQDPGVANPPSLLLPLAWLVGIAVGPESPAAGALASRARLGSVAELRQLVVGFGTAALPRLAAWYGFLSRSQKSSHKGGCFRWAGRSAAHCLASGLDDYPRGLLVNEDECHLDLHAWMALFSGTIAALCQQLGESARPASWQAVCQQPDWPGRARALNASLYELFAPEGKPSEPLADYLGRQPVSANGQALVVPPWRTDGRCGPEFPSGRRPGECDPYGGAPCCSPSGWCGGSPEFCDCPGCRHARKLEERKDMFSSAQPSHSPHLGYVSLFPALLGLMPWEHQRARKLLEALQPVEEPTRKGKRTGTLWSAHGVMSLSAGDPLFRQGEDYWRGKVWANLNYLTISALARPVPPGSPVAELVRRAHESLRTGFVGAVLGALERQRFFFENFDPATGEGRGVGPFTGWTTLVVLVMADEPISLDLAQLLRPGKAGAAEL